MPNKISQKQILDAILKGITNAEKNYEKWADGEILAFTAEHVLYGFIAKSILKITGCRFVEIEPQCKEAIKAACVARRGKLPATIRPKGHNDILLYGTSGKPIAVIEVKHNVYNYDGQCEKDIKRITKMIGMSGTKIRFGVFAFYMSASPSKTKSARQILEDRFNSLKVRIEGYCGNNFIVNSDKKIYQYRDINDKKSAWAASCFVLNVY